MKDYKKHQQDLTELNSDGNDNRGREGETLDEAKELSEEEQLKQKLADLRRRDPFVYR
jgi:hypothetical protein